MEGKAMLTAEGSAASAMKGTNAITMAIELTRLQTINFVQKDIAELMSYYRRDNN